jgi:diguanylate cyclase (GGDEF)-like protein/PAS domain S-box-containing protein
MGGDVEQVRGGGARPLAAGGLVGLVAVAGAVVASWSFSRRLRARVEVERQQAEEELRSRTRWFAAIVEQSSDLITLFDADGIVTWVSPSVGTLLGRRPEDLLGLSIIDLIHREDRSRVLTALHAVRQGQPARAEYRVVSPTGEWIWLESTASDLLDDPDVQAIIALSRDVTERHRTTELLVHRAAHDPLTGLANRTELERQLDARLAHLRSSGEPLAVAYLDLDGFKAVNDSHGHAAGDRLLRAVADSLRQQVREGDLIARVGGDEFVLVLPGAAVPSAVATAERVRGALAEPMAIEGLAEPVQVTVSIGLAMGASDDTVGLLLHEADLALYEAKRRGRNRVELSGHGTETEEADVLEITAEGAG